MNDNYGFEPEYGEFSENLTQDLGGGLHSALYKKISALTVHDDLIQAAFQLFLKSAEFGETFTVYDLIFGCESVSKGYEPLPDPGKEIYCVENLSYGKNSAELFKNSVGGIYALLGLNNGLEIDIDSAGGSLNSAETRRFAVLTPAKAAKLQKKTRFDGIRLTKCGRVLSEDRFTLKRGGSVIASVDKNVILNAPKCTLNVGREHRSDFISGYNAMCSYSSCSNVNRNNVIRFGLGGDLPAVFARALGYFSAALYLKAFPVNLIFTPDEQCGVSVPRPTVNDGDAVYLLKLRLDQQGLPDKIHHGQLNFYLYDLKSRNIIKDALPLKENVESVLGQLCGDSLEYVPMAQVPENSFGVIVTVNRGAPLNGVKIGYFKTKNTL